MTKCQTVVLTPTQRLAGVQPEFHAKKRMGKQIVYVAQDRMGEITLLSQQLQLLASAINERAGDAQSERVSTTTLWKGVDRSDASRVGVWIKGRWRVRSVDLNEASNEFERARQAHTHAAVVAAQPACWVVS